MKASQTSIRRHDSRQATSHQSPCRTKMRRLTPRLQHPPTLRPTHHGCGVAARLPRFRLAKQPPHLPDRKRGSSASAAMRFDWRTLPNSAAGTLGPQVAGPSPDISPGNSGIRSIRRWDRPRLWVGHDVVGRMVVGFCFRWRGRWFSPSAIVLKGWVRLNFPSQPSLGRFYRVRVICEL